MLKTLRHIGIFLKMKRVRAVIDEIDDRTSLEIAEDLAATHPKLFPHSLDYTAKFVAVIMRDMGKDSSHLKALYPRKAKPRKGVLITR